MSWYCAKLIGHENTAANYLRRLGIKVFVPEAHRYYVDKRTKKERHRVAALFVGYGFVWLENDAQRAQAVSARVVAYLLGSWMGERFLPREMPIEWVSKLMDAGPLIVGKRVEYKRGERVKVLIGRLAEQILELEGEKNGKLVARMEMLGAVRRVQLNPDQVEKVRSD